MPQEMKQMICRVRLESDRIRERKGKTDHVRFEVDGARKTITFHAHWRKLSSKIFDVIKMIASW